MSAITDRRDFVATLAGLGLAGVSGLTGFAAAAAAEPQGSQMPQQQPVEALGRLPWPYRPLDADAVAALDEVSSAWEVAA